MNQAELVASLREELEALTPGIAEHEARRVLLFLLKPPPPTSNRMPHDSQTCPNCDRVCDNLRSPYCSDVCKEMSALIRQTRSALETGAIRDPERQVAIGQKLWHLLGGGYPLRLAIMPPSAARQVAKRTGGKCEICGNPASTYDHLGSG